jgi:hypothetical protein
MKTYQEELVIAALDDARWHANYARHETHYQGTAPLNACYNYGEAYSMAQHYNLPDLETIARDEFVAFREEYSIATTA